MENPAIYYHDRTKHYPWRYAASPGYLDWDTQPNPYRFWEGAPTVELPLLPDSKTPYEYLYLYPEGAKSFNLENLSKFLELALGLAAVKSAGGSTWTVRMNPSSGNLHPTECYLIIPDIAGLRGIYHYNPYLHALEKIRELPLQAASLIKSYYGTEGFIAVLTSVPWRESWKYGERALRYCLLDAGHAAGSVRFSANLKGWKVKYLNAAGDDELTTLLGFDKVSFPEGEEEYPELALFVFSNTTEDVPRDLPPALVELVKDLPLLGKPNTLSPERVIWEIVYETFEALKKPKTPPVRYRYGNKPLLMLAPPKIPVAEEIIRKRRSGHIYNPSVYLKGEEFLQILDRTVARDLASPFDAEISPNYVSLILFVHRVEGFPKGLYAFIRNKKHLHLMREHLSKNFLWREVYENLYLLGEGDLTREAGYLSCTQDIAADSAFAVAMVAEFEPVVSARPWEYRTVHYEAGLIGQALYIEATALGYKGTGIGCFFDDLTHELLGLANIEAPFGGNLLQPKVAVDRTLQVVYHFTVGGAFEDPRIQTYPPYAHRLG